MTWAPGEDELIHDRLISGGGWIERPGATCLNLYRPPALVPGNSAEAEPWLDHVHKVFGEDDGRHIVMWLAQRCSNRRSKSIILWCSAAPRGLARTRCLSR